MFARLSVQILLPKRALLQSSLYQRSAVKSHRSDENRRSNLSSLNCQLSTRQTSSDRAGSKNQQRDDFVDSKLRRHCGRAIGTNQSGGADVGAATGHDPANFVLNGRPRAGTKRDRHRNSKRRRRLQSCEARNLGDAHKYQRFVGDHFCAIPKIFIA